MTGIKVSGVYMPYEVFNTQKASSPEKPKKTDLKRDEVDLSSQAKDYQALTKILSDVPDVREDVVSSIKAGYESGTYSVSPDDVAEKLVSKWAALE